MLKPTILLAVALPLAAAPLTQPDRDKLTQDLQHSRQMFLDAIADVKTEAQWNYKPGPDRWSVGECAAHIIAAEDYFRQNVSAALQKPPLAAQQQSNAGDAIIAKMVRDRSTKYKAPGPLEPAGKVQPKPETIAAFEATRAKTLEYVRTTQDALREHGEGTPPAVTSAFQMVLMLSGHTERHTAQLLEVKASPGYPKN
jgi:DinB family protein